MTVIKLSKKNIKIFSLIFIAVISIWMVWQPTYNYIQFYKAVERLDISVSRSNFTFIHENYRALITLNITIENPTEYKGIGIVSLIFSLKFITDNITMDLKKGQRIWFKEEPGEPLEPYSRINKSEKITLNFENKREIFEEIESLQQSGNKIELFLGDVAFDVSLFLGRMIIPVGNIAFNDS